MVPGARTTGVVEVDEAGSAGADSRTVGTIKSPVRLRLALGSSMLVDDMVLKGRLFSRVLALDQKTARFHFDVDVPLSLSFSLSVGRRCWVCCDHVDSCALVSRFPGLSPSVARFHPDLVFAFLSLVNDTSSHRRSRLLSRLDLYWTMDYDRQETAA